MPNCHQLTVEELEAKIAAGYTLVGTPSATMAECLLACGSGPTHETACCPGVQIPDALPITFSGCANGTGTILYSGASDPGVLDIWYGSVTLDCITMEVIVQCSEGVWGIYFPGDATCGPGTPSSTCDPFCVEFVIENLACIEADCPACAFPATLTIQIGCNFTPFTVTYDADATFTPTFSGNVQVECWGAGGSSDWDTSASGGGGGGAYSKLDTYAVTSGSPYTVSVAPDSSEDTYFVNAGTVMAKSGASVSLSPTGGSGGAAGSGVGDTKWSGGNGANAAGGSGGGGGGSATSSANGGNASGATGGTGESAGRTGGTSGNGGVNGVGPGGGASGAGDSAPPGPAFASPGRVIITRIS